MGFAFNHLNSVTDVRIEWESHQNENYGKEKKGKKRKRGGSQTPGFSPFQPRRRQQIITHPKLKFYQRWALSSLSLCAQPKTSVPLSACHAAASHQIQSHSSPAYPSSGRRAEWTSQSQEQCSQQLGASPHSRSLSCPRSTQLHVRTNFFLLARNSQQRLCVQPEMNDLLSTLQTFFYS